MQTTTASIWVLNKISAVMICLLFYSPVSIARLQIEQVANGLVYGCSVCVSSAGLGISHSLIASTSAVVSMPATCFNIRLFVR